MPIRLTPVGKRAAPYYNGPDDSLGGPGVRAAEADHELG